MRLKDLTGERFGRLVVEHRAENKGSQTMWLCHCDCGKTTIVSAGHLKDGHTTSCGCFHNETMKKMMTTHNQTKTRLYKIWRGIIDRTMYSSHGKYKNYGGRGITLCDEWKDFVVFREWAVDNGYADDLTIDRINSNGNYEPSNCRWTTMKVQQNNRTNNHLITCNGETHTMKEWSEIRGIKYSTLSMRVNKRKWSIPRALGYV